MHRIEEVFVAGNDTDYEDTEYLMEAAEKSSVLVKTPQKVEPASTMKKVPIIRKAGEIVFPVHMKMTGNVKVSPSTPKNVQSTAKPSPKNILLGLENKHKDHNETTTPAASGSVSLDSLGEQMGRLENKLDQALAKLSQHDNALKILKHNVKDLRIELRNSSKVQAQIVSFTDEQMLNQNIKPKRSRKRLILFPVADDHYLARLEELVQADEEMRDELIDLFNEAPNTSVYEYLRKNVHCLFLNTSKFTWTGKPATGPYPGPPSNPAYKMQLVELLLTCCADKFPNATRSFLEKEFRHALQNFNDAKMIRERRRQQLAGKESFTVSFGEQLIPVNDGNDLEINE
ncbi:uncharacterized protein LOC131681569 [Topomyia yanbarensis]|uniref:uncharacterized protein LOC131681569 n=1 Tax=Topomyia yanbarensis TaxID=2498891 RepID=UPI00273AE00B|nr:uncharacterized protein LOC131681569 [Topomyia yanbarensis]